MRKQIVAGNWKMNKTKAETAVLANDLNNELKNTQISCELIIFPTFLGLEEAIKSNKQSIIKVGAQNCHFEDSGAFTGEISPMMLADLGADYVIIGHSERRKYFQETEEIVLSKIKAGLAAGLKIMYCCGEPLEIRENNTQNEFVLDQLTNSIFKLSTEELENVVIAYEPVWAIGTGKTASPEQAQDMHHFIRESLKNHFSEEIADKMSLLYGGSCKPSNAKEIFGQKDVDGGLIGGASLKAEDFIQIATSF